MCVSVSVWVWNGIIECNCICIFFSYVHLALTYCRNDVVVFSSIFSLSFSALLVSEGNGRHWSCISALASSNAFKTSEMHVIGIQNNELCLKRSIFTKCMESEQMSGFRIKWSFCKCIWRTLLAWMHEQSTVQCMQVNKGVLFAGSCHRFSLAPFTGSQQRRHTTNWYIEILCVSDTVVYIPKSRVTKTCVRSFTHASYPYRFFVFSFCISAWHGRMQRHSRE